MKSLKICLVMGLLGLLSAAPARAGDKKDIVDTAVGAGQFGTLVKAVQAAGLVETLKGAGPFTVFAPTDEAFAKLPAGTLDELLKPENKAQLTGILTYHVVGGALKASEVTQSAGAVTVNGQMIRFTAGDGSAKVEKALIVKTDIECSNGIIHVIDAVILPAGENIVQTAANAGQFKTLLAAATAAGLAETLATGGPFTVFAPTDEAFAKLGEETLATLLQPENKEKLAGILKYHVVAGRIYSTDALKVGKAATLQGGTLAIAKHGDKATVGNAGLVATDIDAANGVIHVIDTVLLPE